LENPIADRDPALAVYRDRLSEYQRGRVGIIESANDVSWPRPSSRDERNGNLYRIQSLPTASLAQSQPDIEEHPTIPEPQIYVAVNHIDDVGIFVQNGEIAHV
jgi:hypothetical protein